ncbi:MAG: DUF4339 domain-containing protein [Planctomycetes bacterium]|nr:DUF4339 domain-containing protein [Planctomycetota bacterium]
MARFRIRDKQGREYGPVDASELRYWIMDARLTADMLIQQEGLKDWYRAGDVPAIARLLAERAAATASARASSARSGGSGTPPEPPVSAAASTTSPVGAAASTNSPGYEIASAATSGEKPLGLVDRVLRIAFQFARSISVLVIIMSLLVVLAGSAVAFYARMPQPRFTDGAIDQPTLREFVEDCSQAVPQQEAPSGRLRPRDTELLSVDDCGPFRQRSEAIVARLRIAPESVEVVCSRIASVSTKHRIEFIDGLERLAEEFQSNPPKERDCSGADAANWYMREFDRRLSVEQAEEAIARSEANERRELLIPALSAIGLAVAALLVFMILPLLIQIERNTRVV